MPRPPPTEGLPYDVGMTAPLERPKTPASVAIVGSIVAVVIGFIILNMVIGFVLTLAKIAIGVVIVVAVAVAVTRMFGGD